MDESEYLALSGLQHFAFCRRQWALIHIENLWAENLRTVDGQIMHEKAHDQERDSLRFYNLGNHYQSRIEHFGAKPAYDPEDCLIV